jgi:hypothetical protein
MRYNANTVGFADTEEMVVAMTNSKVRSWRQWPRSSWQTGSIARCAVTTGPHSHAGMAGGLRNQLYDTRLGCRLPEVRPRRSGPYGSGGPGLPPVYRVSTGNIDGVMGRFTRSAMNEVQQSSGLPLTDTLDLQTYTALQQATVNG